MNIADFQNSSAHVIKVLVVDDYEPFRKQLVSVLLNKPGFEIVGEATDGYEGVQKAIGLKPDVVIVDVALPKLNGIEVTRQIRSASLDSKIIFLTGNDFPQVAIQAFEAGANGYVVKADAGLELLAGIRTVLEGKRFVSKRLVDRCIVKLA